MALFQYSARNVLITISPLNPLYKPFNVLGYGENEFLTVSCNEDDFTTTEGADGLVVRSFHTNSIATVSLTLQQTSPCNDKFSFLRNKDRKNIGDGIFRFDVRMPPITKDIAGIVNNVVQNGLPSMISGICYASKLADNSFAKDAGERQWNFTLVDPVIEETWGQQVYDLAINTLNDVNIAAGMINSKQ